MSVILGLNTGHPDTSACLAVNGEVTAAISEERLGRRYKYDPSFPIQAIKFVLEKSDLDLRDVTDIAISRNTKSNLIPKLKYALSKPNMVSNLAQKNLARQNSFKENLISLYGSFGLSSRFVAPIYPVEHHVAHIASAYYTHANDGICLGVSYDGSGDFASVMIAECRDKHISPRKRLHLPHSLGHFYSAMCQFIGFDNFGEEYKVMGLAPYGNPVFIKELSRILNIGSVHTLPKLNSKYINVQKALRDSEFKVGTTLRIKKLYTKHVEEIFGRARSRDEPLTQREMDIARSTQVVFESAASNIIKLGLKTVKANNLVLAGGCALNGVMNAKIERDFRFDNVYQHSASGDDGTALGAALYCYNKKYADKKAGVLKGAYLGQSYNDNEIIEILKKENCSYSLFSDDDELLKYTAEAIIEGKVIGWFQGRSEWGPRALGNRSILASPLIPDMKSIINEKIKKRESFRPFAPSVLEEDVANYFVQDIKSPYMMHVVKFKPEYQNKFPAVTHVDGTGRVQSVNKEFNPRYYALLKHLKEKCGHGVVLNTSFNENEPIVETPLQALSVFQRTDIDLLVLGNVVVVR